MKGAWLAALLAVGCSSSAPPPAASPTPTPTLPPQLTQAGDHYRWQPAEGVSGVEFFKAGDLKHVGSAPGQRLQPG